MTRIEFYQKYFKNISPSTFDVIVNGDKIEISGFENSEYFTSNQNMKKIEDYNLLKTVNLEKGGQTNFNPDGIIKNKIVHASGKAGGMLVGERHSEGGIKAINKSTGQPIEMEGGEVVITRNAVSDNTKRSFNGKMMTNRQILSAINESGGGVSFADGGEVPNDLKFDCNAEYEYGGRTMCGKDLAYAMGGVTTAIVTDPNEAMADLQSTYGFGDVYANGGEVKWIKNIDEEFGWNENPYEHIGGYISEDGDYKIYQEGKWVTRDFGETFIRKGAWTVDYKDKPIGYRGSSERMYLSNLKDAKEFVSQINNQKFAKGGTIECGSCDWSWNRKDGGDDMYVCHKCGTDNSKNYKKGGAVDDDMSDLISSVEALNSQFEEGGVLENNILLKSILPLSSGKGKDRILISIYGNNVSGELVHIQFGNNTSQPLSNEVVSYFLNVEKGSIVDRVIITGDGWRTKGISATVFSFIELIDFFQKQTVEGDWIFEFIPSQNQALPSFSTDVIKLNIAGKLRKPTSAWRKKYYFSQKNIKKDILSFFEKFITVSPFYLNLIPFILGTTPVKKTLDDLKQKEALEQQEKEKKEKEQAELLDKYLADTTKTTFFNKNIVDKSFIEEKNTLLKLLPSFDEIRFSKERALIFKELRKIEDRISNTFFENLTNDNLFSNEGLLNYYFTQSTQSPVQELDKPCELPTLDSGKSDLPYGAYLNVRTDQFKKWFGDWEQAYLTNNYVGCSIAIDNNFEPKIFYHGVRRFQQGIQSSAMGSGITRPYGSFTPSKFPASYFSDKKSYAEFYSGESKNLPKSIQSKGFIYPVFLRIIKPLDIRLLGFECTYNDFIDYIRVVTGIKIEKSKNILDIFNGDDTVNPVWNYVRNDIQLLETIKDFGYDGLIQIGDIPTYDKSGNVVSDRTKWIKEDEYLTFYPNQVKSVVSKKSYYLNLFDDIRFKKGGYVSL